MAIDELTPDEQVQITKALEKKLRQLGYKPSSYFQHFTGNTLHTLMSSMGLRDSYAEMDVNLAEYEQTTRPSLLKPDSMEFFRERFDPSPSADNNPDIFHYTDNVGAEQTATTTDIHDAISIALDREAINKLCQLRKVILPKMVR